VTPRERAVNDRRRYTGAGPFSERSGGRNVARSPGSTTNARASGSRAACLAGTIAPTVCVAGALLTAAIVTLSTVTVTVTLLTSEVTVEHRG
jgi:hypothetical protein